MSELAVDLWVARLTAEPMTPEAASACAAVLSQSERDAVARFRHRGRREQALVARALVRQALSRRLGGPPKSWEFQREPSGRPRIAGGHGLDFNIAHCDGCVVLAIADAGRVGVDVEPFARAPAIRDVAARILAPKELADLSGLDPEAQDRRLVMLWTLKEAWAKAKGDGLGMDFRTLAFEAVGDRFVLPRSPKSRFATFDVAPAHGVAVAYEPPVQRVKQSDGWPLLLG